MRRYDVIIIGCGPAGMACGMSLAKVGLSCLILESKPTVGTKVCGDALSIDGVKLLGLVGLDVNKLLSVGGREIRGHKMYCNGKIISECNFCNGNALGISRSIFDKLLLDSTREAGVKVLLRQRVSRIDKKDDGYCVNGTYYSDQVVLAAGATGAVKFNGYTAKGFPMGISSRIKCHLSLKEDCFYVFRDSSYAGGYAWIFPIGDNLWNIGVWTPELTVKMNLRHEYELFESRIVKTETSDFSYDRKPQGALIGSFDNGSQDRAVIKCSEFRRIGDNALQASFYSGEGIRMAIQSGILEAQKIIGGINNNYD